MSLYICEEKIYFSFISVIPPGTCHEFIFCEDIFSVSFISVIPPGTCSEFIYF